MLTPVDLAKNIGEDLIRSGYETRFAGGCVRDILLGLTPHDYDLATTATPQEVIKTLEKLGYKVIPTGIDHGTVTVVRKRIPVEVTTLRNDVRCDGRHAQISYTTQFEEDALRRDFTINALYQGMDGTIYDYTRGLGDLKKRELRFVGSADQRIQEDALRILRYFRFLAKLGWDFNPEYKPVFQARKSLLGILSRERIKMEMDTILGYAPSDLLSIMENLDLWPFLFPDHTTFQDTDLSQLFDQYPDSLKPLEMKWFALLNSILAPQLEWGPLTRVMRFSKKESIRLEGLRLIIQSINLGFTGLVPILPFLKRSRTNPMDLREFLNWHLKKEGNRLPKITSCVLEKIASASFPTPGKQIQKVNPIQKRKQFAFIFQISCYLGLCKEGEIVNFDTLNLALKEWGFHSEKEFHEFQ